MADVTHNDPTKPGEGPPVAPPAPVNIWAMLPLAIVWAIAATPVVLYLVHQSDPILAAQIIAIGQTWLMRVLLSIAAVAVVALLFFPPFPAWVRRFLDRTKTSWSVDRAPLLQALADLKHLETAQRHFEVARLAWIRQDYALVGPHVQRAVQLDPSMAQAHYLFGQFLLRIGALPQAQIVLTAAIGQDPGHAFGNALLLLAHVTHQLGDNDRALQLFEKHEREHGGGHRSNYWFGEALLGAGRKDDAKQKFAKAAAAPPQKLTAEENWYRALARVKSFRLGGAK